MIGSDAARAAFSPEELAKLERMLLVYEWGQRTLLTRLSIIRDGLLTSGDSCPIESIQARIKTPDSIAGKLRRLGADLTAESARGILKDVAGVRIICPFSKDILYLVGLLRGMSDTTITDEKDYVSKPKPSGYRSYHLIMEVPVFHSGGTENVPVELQIRTEAMNFWAMLEHKAKYKYDKRVPDHLRAELVLCADKIAELDKRMFLIHEIIALINEGD
ncbi:MAG: GTP pyrophosphokinase family protein [Treponema sp.]|nr:GTP pyrophosphokinase family protein [Treponema sp.]